MRRRAAWNASFRWGAPTATTTDTSPTGTRPVRWRMAMPRGPWRRIASSSSRPTSFRASLGYAS